MSETSESARRPDPMGFRALRRRWRDLPDPKAPSFADPETERRMLRALDTDFDALLAEPGFADFMHREEPRRLTETVARVARWRRAFGESS